MLDKIYYSMNKSSIYESDENIIWQIATDHEAIITVEEGSIGGFSAQVMSFLTKSAALDRGLKFRPLFFQNRFII